MKKVLVFVDYFVPGYKAGGPIQSMKAILTKLGEEFKFKVLTTIHDASDTEPYAGIVENVREVRFGAEAYYLNRRLGVIPKYIRHLRGDYDVIYINSFFSLWFSIIPMFLIRMMRISGKRIVIAPRGQFADGALSIRRSKKERYIRSARSLGIYRDVVWHATSDQEVADIRSKFGASVEIVLAPNLKVRNSNLISEDSGGQQKKLRGLYLSRLSPKKNIKFMLEILEASDVDLEFDIYGPIRDEKYWDECVAMLKRPSLSHVKYKGEVHPDNVQEIMSGYDFFLFPTLSENFGHVILEALCAGVTVITSDQTPWNDLEENEVGWSLSLEDRSEYEEKLKILERLDSSQRRLARGRSVAYADRYINSPEVLNSNRSIFSGSEAKN